MAPQTQPVQGHDTGANAARNDGGERARRRKYPTRTCRICLGDEEPTFPTPGIIGSLGYSPKPTYRSDDPELGRLFSPCRCKGTQKYVHEGCLHMWRAAGQNARNTFECTTCGFKYRFARISSASYLRSWLVRMMLTMAIFLGFVFALGFIANPIISMWNDPIGTVTDTVTNMAGFSEFEPVLGDTFLAQPDEWLQEGGWLEHWIKGVFSLGILGFLKVIITLSPFQWWNLRSSGIIGGRRPVAAGRNRVENINIILVLMGVGTFVYALWKGIGRVSSKLMEGLADHVLDVGGDDDDDQDQDQPETTGAGVHGDKKTI